MKRKLIDFDVFRKIESESLSNAERELVGAEDVLAQALQQEAVSLHCYGDSHVLYETLDDTYIYASYTLEKDAITLEGIEELVVDEEQEKQNARGVLRSLVEELIDDNEMKAHEIFDDYVSLPVVKRQMEEASYRAVQTADGSVKKKLVRKPRKHYSGARKAAMLRGRKKANRLKGPAQKRRERQAAERRRHKVGLKMANEVINQINTTAQNVLEYVDFRALGPALKESVAKHDEKGNVIALRIPTINVRNEGKILSFNWKTLNHEVKCLRDGSKKLAESTDFCKAVAELKRHNAFEDSDDLQESLEGIVTQWPNVIYLTQSELAKIIQEALEIVGVSAYDDQICDFMAEGILRTAHEVHTDSIDRILRLANQTDCQKYECFQEAVGEFYSELDESAGVEMRVFYDLYTVVGEIYSQANRDGDEILAEEAQEFLRDLHAIVEGEIEPDVDLAETVAEWVQCLMETNLNSSEWNPSNKVHITTSGDHPRMAQNAGVPYSPKNDFSGDWGDVAPVSDGKNYKGSLAGNMRNRSWGNVGDSDTYPSLQNPYVPKPYGDYTMKGEPSVDKNHDGGLGQDQGSDTWPNLQNPYVPKAETPQSYKMNKGKEKDLVIDQ